MILVTHKEEYTYTFAECLFNINDQNGQHQTETVPKEEIEKKKIEKVLFKKKKKY